MPQPEALLDTDVLSAVMKGNPLALARAAAYLSEHGAFAFSIITRYEDHFGRIPGLQVANWLRP